jgi:hypothetical protein
MMPQQEYLVFTFYVKGSLNKNVLTIFHVVYCNPFNATIF